jgi:hypothetical protein
MRKHITSIVLCGVGIFSGCSSTTSTPDDGGMADAGYAPDNAIKKDAATDSSTKDAATDSPTTDAGTCSLTANTTATSTVTYGCTLVTRDTSSCKAAREAAGITGAWLKFSCRVSLTKSGNNVVLATDSQPDHTSYYFGSTHACYSATAPTSPNPNSISALSLSMNIATAPNTTGQAMGGGYIGVAVNGVGIYSNVAAPGDDIYKETTTFDPCQGHASAGNKYHYHSEAYSLSYNDSNLLGVFRDGYFLYGRKDADGSTPTLDANGGHTGTTADSTTAVYHYHLNLQTSTTTGTAGQTAWFMSKGTYKGTQGTCTGCN